MKFWDKVFGKKKIDERQQADLNRMMSYGYWIAFYLLLAAIMVEGVFMRRPFREWAVEWIVFMVIAVYEVIACIRIGVWTQFKQMPGRKDYLRYSLIGGVLCAVVFTIGNVMRMDAKSISWQSVAAVFAWWFAVMFVLCLAGFYVCGGIYRKRKKRLEEKMDEELEEDEDEE